ncbi:HAD family hydrolase [Clostridium transplantifaecale]|uniref:HAD family hydrolase n=1 Tax=Clostridium transplantifaecale TaxID=2479838 RepID=UPI000F63B6B2|nr:HAD family phosphatase [Clostridium transplantifaecale]
MIIEGVIFDMDGLMFDTERLGLEGWKKAGRILGYPVGEEVVAGIRGCNRADAKKKFKAQYGEGFNYEQALQIRLHYAEEMLRKQGIPVKPGLYRLLETLRNKRIPMGVATGSSRETALSNLKNAGIREYFSAIVCGDEVEHAKPWPDIFIRTAECLGTDCSRTMVFEDSSNGIEAASRAGCIPVMVPDLTRPDDALRAKCYRVIENLGEAGEFFERK